MSGTAIAVQTSLSSNVPEPMTAQLWTVYKDLVQGIQWSGSTFTLERLPTDDEREALIDRYRLITPATREASYSSASLQRAGAAIAEMFKSWPNFKPQDKEQSIGHYVTMMKGIPLFAIQQACSDVAHGEVPDLSPHFPPGTPFMCQLARSKAQALVDQHANLKKILSTKVARVEYHASPEEQVRVRDQLRDLADAFQRDIDEADAARRNELGKATLERNRREIIDEYRARNIPPVMGPGGVPISLSLIRNIQEYQQRPPPDQGHQDQGS